MRFTNFWTVEKANIVSWKLHCSLAPPPLKKSPLKFHTWHGRLLKIYNCNKTLQSNLNFHCAMATVSGVLIWSLKICFSQALGRRRRWPKPASFRLLSLHARIVLLVQGGRVPVSQLSTQIKLSAAGISPDSLWRGSSELLPFCHRFFWLICFQFPPSGMNRVPTVYMAGSLKLRGHGRDRGRIGWFFLKAGLILAGRGWQNKGQIPAFVTSFPPSVFSSMKWRCGQHMWIR